MLSWIDKFCPPLTVDPVTYKLPPTYISLPNDEVWPALIAPATPTPPETSKAPVAVLMDAVLLDIVVAPKIPTSLLKLATSFTNICEPKYAVRATPRPPLTTSAPVSVDPLS